MKIELHQITVRELIDGYNAVAPEDDGVMGYGGRLIIRPAYQREFVYKLKQQQAVINSILNNFPLNVMYWVKTGADKYELLDGQQRTLSICGYRNGGFPFEDKLFSSLTSDRQDHILDYKLMVYVCEGKDSEVLDWFEIINIAGESLKPQEVRNAVYTCEWLSDAKRYFSKTGCIAYRIASDYMDGVPNRQDYLETVIKWHAQTKADSDIRQYMAERKDSGAGKADELIAYFNQVIEWVRKTFPHKNQKPAYKKEMNGIDWGVLYNMHKGTSIDAAKLAKRIAALMEDEDVQSKKGIFSYVLDGDEKHLNLRVFNNKQKREAYERQDGICASCKEQFEIEEMEGDHIDPWSTGGKTDADNCQMLCKKCNRRKGDK